MLNIICLYDIIIKTVFRRQFTVAVIFNTYENTKTNEVRSLKRIMVPIILTVLIVVTSLLVSCMKSSIPPVEYNPSLDNESQQLFGYYQAWSVCQNGGYYYTAMEKGVQRQDPDGGCYRIANNGYYHSLQVVENYVYALEKGPLGGYKCGISKISVNGDSLEKLLEDLIIGRYVVYHNTIYFTELHDGETDGVIYEYTDGKVTELPIIGAEWFYVYNGSLLYSDEQAIYKYDSVKQTKAKLIDLPENSDEWLPIQDGFAIAIEDEDTSAVVYLEDGMQPVEFFPTCRDFIGDLGVIENCIFARASLGDTLYVYHIDTQETTQHTISPDVDSVICNGDQLIACFYDDRKNQLVVEPILHLTD